MKHTHLTRKVLLGIVCFLFCSFSAIAQQSNYLKGYIITNSNDTIYGEISLRTDKINGSECRFRTSAEESPKVYYPGSILAYRYTPGKFYVSRTVEIGNAPETVFLEYLIEGGLNLFYYRSSLYTYYFLEGADKKLVAMDNKRVERWLDSPTGMKKYEGINQNYKGLTATMMRDWTLAQERVVNLKLDHKDMVKIVVDYNDAVCTEDSCVVYWSNNPTPLKVSYALFAGNISGFPIYNSKSNGDGYQAGVQFLFNSPRFSKSLNLLAELNYTHITSDRLYGAYQDKGTFKTSSHGLDVRIMGRYSFGSARVRPFAEAGFLFTFSLAGKSDADISNGGCPILGAGLLCRVFADHDIFIQGFWNARRATCWGLRAGFIF